MSPGPSPSASQTTAPARVWHPGWSGWFTWRGYRGRLSYIGATLLNGLAVGLVVAALAALAGFGAGGDWTALALIAVAVIAVVILAGLIVFACILAQRLRDIGMPVVPTILAYVLASLLASAAIALQETGESAALWNPDWPLWLNLLQLALTVFSLALLIVPGNAWLDAED